MDVQIHKASFAAITGSPIEAKVYGGWRFAPKGRPGVADEATDVL